MVELRKPRYVDNPKVLAKLEEVQELYLQICGIESHRMGEVEKHLKQIGAAFWNKFESLDTMQLDGREWFRMRFLLVGSIRVHLFLDVPYRDSGGSVTRKKPGVWVEKIRVSSINFDELEEVMDWLEGFIELLREFVYVVPGGTS